MKFTISVILYNSVFVSAFTMLCNHHQFLIQSISSPPKEAQCLLVVNPYPLMPTINLLLVSVRFAYSGHFIS